MAFKPQKIVDLDDHTNTSSDDKEPLTFQGASFAFNPRMGKKVWWGGNLIDSKGQTRSAIMPDEPTDMVDMLNFNGGNFPVGLAQSGFMYNGNFVSDRTFKVIRSDTLETLNPNVIGSYNIRSHAEVLSIPEANSNLSEHLVPWTCSIWPSVRTRVLGGRAVGQYAITETEMFDSKVLTLLTIMSFLDGTGTCQFWETLVDVVCQNTLAHSLVDFSNLSVEDKNLQKIRRTARSEDRFNDWSRHIEVVLRNSSKVGDKFKNFERKITREQIQKAIDFFFPVDSSTKTGKTRQQNIQEAFRSTLYNGPGQDQREMNTAWWLYSGLTAFNQHVAGVKGVDTDNLADQRRLGRLWFDEQNSLNNLNEQFQYCQELVA